MGKREESPSSPFSARLCLSLSQLLWTRKERDCAVYPVPCYSICTYVCATRRNDNANTGCSHSPQCCFRGRKPPTLSTRNTSVLGNWLFLALRIRTELRPEASDAEHSEHFGSRQSAILCRSGMCALSEKERKVGTWIVERRNWPRQFWPYRRFAQS